MPTFASLTPFIVGLQLGVLLVLWALSPHLHAPARPFVPEPPPDFQFGHELASAPLYSLLSPYPRDGGYETLAFNSRGELFGTALTGIYKLSIARNTSDEYAYTGHRPLGLAFDAEDTAIVADPVQGLYEIDAATKSQRSLLKRVDGRPMFMCDYTVVAQNGNDVYVSDASTQGIVFDTTGQPRPMLTGIFATLASHRTGRVIHYQRSTGRARVLLDGLVFANGLALSPDEGYLLAVDTARYVVQRIWLTGERAGIVEPFASNLPCMGDNIVYSAALHGYLLACPSPRNAVLDALHPYAMLKGLVALIPERLLPKDRFGACLLLGMDGALVRAWADAKGERVHATTHCLEREGRLYVTGFEMNGVAVLDVASGLGQRDVPV